MSSSIRERLWRLSAAERLTAPFPGEGRSDARHRMLMEIAQEDLELARLAEGHLDATAILHEAQRSPRAQAFYGVWASEQRDARLSLSEQVDGSFALTGAKGFCSGAACLEAALVTCWRGDKRVLVDVDLGASGIHVDATAWASPAFASSCPATVRFESVAVGKQQIIGGEDWYFDRPGFWQGALGPAACWAGGALGLVESARQRASAQPHAQAQLGGLLAQAWALRAVLDAAGTEIDANRGDAACARRVALSARHVIERACTDVLDRYGRAVGPGPMCMDAAVSKRCAELSLYIRQCHAERDLQALAEQS